MIVYHGSSLAILKPDVQHSRDNVDFGKGFYTTPIKEQAVKWSERFKSRAGQGVLSIYELDLEACKEDYSVLEFENYDEAWLDYIFACRNMNDASTYDVVIGGVANDKVFNTVELYFEGLIEKEEAIKRLRYDKPNLQICLRNQAVIDKYLRYAGSEEV